MKVFHGIEEVDNLNHTAIAIGNFDGCHLGHAALLEQLVTDCRREGWLSCVLTFSPHPAEVLNPTKRIERLATNEEKLELLAQMNTEAVVLVEFTPELAALTPQAFFQRYILKSLKARSIHIGEGFRFGKNREGDPRLLSRLCQDEGISLRVFPPFIVGGGRVSSSYIRTLIRKGDTLSAKGYLGRPYFIKGKVTRGDQRGYGLGFPTANMLFPSEKIIPKGGVYVTRTSWRDQIFRSVSNVGIRPTFDTAGSSGKVTLEVHLIDFQKNLYDEELRLEFFERLRDEIRFDSIEALQQQISRDVICAKKANLNDA